MILTRAAVAADRPFITSGWSSSYRLSHDCTTPMSLYPRQKHEEVHFYLDRAHALVAHGETGVLFGFIVYDPTTYVAILGGRRITLDGYVLYVYVATPFRRRGIARQLFAAAGIAPTRRFGYLCRTRQSWELRSKIPLAEHEPHRARYEEIEHVRAQQPEVAGEGATREPEGAAADSGDEGQVPR